MGRRDLRSNARFAFRYNGIGETNHINTAREHGVEVIQKLRATNPAAYVKIIASLMPKEVTGENGHPLLGNITVVYRKPGEPAPEPEVVAIATVAEALDAATDEDELPEAAD